MEFYLEIKTIHIIFAGMWLIFFAAEIILKNQIDKASSNEIKNSIISLYLKFSNLFGIVGSTGIAITGIILVLQSPGYGFFDMSHAHWLATKQILFVIILLYTFLKIIPTSKKLRLAIGNNDEEGIENHFTSVKKMNLIVNVIVILNFAFAITHRLYS